MIEILIIILFAAMQSVFGIGILFFGTPTLILLGYPFVETLAVVLPASLAVSLLQVVRGTLPKLRWRRRFTVYCITPLSLMLGASLWWQWQVELELIIACTLFLYVLIRISPNLHTHLREFVRQHKKLWLAVIGAIHGVSNLGGGLLAIFASNSFDDKIVIRDHIAFCYLCFAGIQLSVLAVMTPYVINWMQFVYAAIGGAVFMVCEHKIFHSISLSAFDRAFTIIIGSYSVLVFLKLLGVFGTVFSV
tara:strand:+ start:1614 stop:2357 length:744 start_codon:yes stop_codon:yes gene_type:complete